MTSEDNQEPEAFPATVVEVLSPTRIVINRGAEHGVTRGQRFLLYTLSDEELEDPETGENLGHLEIVKGTGESIHVQDRLTTIESDRKRAPERKKVIRRGPMVGIGGVEQETIVPESGSPIPFDDPSRGDYVKPV